MGGSKRKQREKLISEEFTQSLFGKESSIAATPDENIFFVDDASQKSKERKSAKAKAAPARKAAKAGAKGAASTAGRGVQSTAVAAAPSALSKAAIAAAAAEGDASLSGAADWGDLGEVEACWAGGDAPCEEEGAARKKQKRSKLRQRKETAGVVMATDAPALPRPDSAFGRVVGPSKAAKAGGVLGATHKAVAALHKPIKRAAPKKQRVVKARRPKWLARYKTAA